MEFKSINDLMNNVYELHKRSTYMKDTLFHLKYDINARQHNYDYHYIIDFSEIFRYMHPYYDRLLKVDEKRFMIEQTILKYLFERSDYSLIIIPAYLHEYHNYLNNLVDKMKSSLDDIKVSKFLKMQVLTESQYKLLSKLVNKPVQELTEKEKNNIYNEAVKQNAIFFLSEKEMAKHIDQASTRFEELISNGRLKTLNHLESRVSNEMYDIPNALKNDAFSKILTNIDKLRPELNYAENNKTDAWATLTTLQLNELNNSSGDVFVLISSAYRIKKAIDHEAVALPLFEHGVKNNLCILRPILYVLLNEYFRQTKNTKEALSRIDTTIHLCKKALNMINKLFTIFNLSKMKDDHDLHDLDLAKLAPEQKKTINDFENIYLRLYAIIFDIESLSLFSGLKEKIESDISSVNIESVLNDVAMTLKNHDILNERMIDSINKIEEKINVVQKLIEKYSL